ncbi:ATP-dependent DEAD/H RNA helicae [Perkinsela sp. CCAP 1560/4]|nr:ATP-dependent DEAD/H RNA helicae [Perkinsela sp. CCAP 1560/4]|eukprot:KNH09600.1 ATP-dependent DEAD/H RNA helicae [Perkinsela sp. CCAP 1560/4]
MSMPAEENSSGSRTPAFTFPYTLDKFQSESIGHLENGDSVLVSAHTSAGKTTVATYAIAMHLRDKRRVIYTSPIKALSNQKFREFSDTFSSPTGQTTASVGLMTGDTTIRSNADCLVMTTEILRSMLYRGTEMLREVGCVIFDEVHYMRDKHRGVVWEETIILLPRKCQYIFLSATIPNGQQFVDWVMHIHPGLKCHVVHTDHRPVPLRHYVCPTGGNGLFPIVDESGVFQEDSYKKALAVLSAMDEEKRVERSQKTGETSVFDTGYQNITAAAKRSRNASNKASPVQQIMQILSHIILNNMHPCIVFVFAKAECESLALSLAKQTFNTEEEEQFVTHTYKNAISGLCDDDQQLPAVQALLPLLQRGIGIHHSGLLPILKEVVELLFSAGLVKVLFSTETFSMGLNMPARTVVFHSIKKYDGTQKRLLTSGEYIQMSGRAGRRGLDKNGVVVTLLDEAIETKDFKNVTCGKADPLISSFHLTYNMVLNLLRIEDADPRIMMRRSFFQYQQEFGKRPIIERQIEELQAKREELRKDISPDVFKVCQQYSTARRVLRRLRSEENQEIFRANAKTVWKFLQVGRIIKFLATTESSSLKDAESLPEGMEMSGVVLSALSRDDLEENDGKNDDSDEQNLRVSVLVEAEMANVINLNNDSKDSVHEIINASSKFEIRPIRVADISCVSKLRIKPRESSFPTKQYSQLQKKVGELITKHGENLMPLDAVKDMKIETEKLGSIRGKIESLEAKIEKSPIGRDASESEYANTLATYEEILIIDKNLEVLNAQLEKLKGALVLEDELQTMIRILRKMDYIDGNNVVLRKGKIACEITTTDQDELLLVELLFRGVFNDMEVELIVALLSCLVNVHKTPDQFDPGEKYHSALRKLYDISAWINKISTESGVAIRDDISVPTMAPAISSTVNSEKIMPSLIDITYQWTQGAKFTQIIRETDAFEGEVVRMMRRLEELLRQMATAAKSSAVGSHLIYEKMMNGIEKIKRDIVFASSLYI